MAHGGPPKKKNGVVRDAIVAPVSVGGVAGPPRFGRFGSMPSTLPFLGLVGLRGARVDFYGGSTVGEMSRGPKSGTRR